MKKATTTIADIALAKAMHTHGNTKKVDKAAPVDMEAIFASVDDIKTAATTQMLTDSVRCTYNTAKRLFSSAYSSATKSYDLKKVLEVYNKHYELQFNDNDRPWLEKLYTTEEASTMFVLATKLSHRKFDILCSISVIPSLRFSFKCVRFRKVDLIDAFSKIIDGKVIVP